MINSKDFNATLKVFQLNHPSISVDVKETIFHDFIRTNEDIFVLFF